MKKRFYMQVFKLAVLAGWLMFLTSFSMAQQTSDLDRGRALRNEGKPFEAIEAFQKYLAANKDDWRAFHNIGLCFKDLNNFRQAIPFFQKAIEINPGDTEAYSLLAEAYNKTGNVKEAINLLEKLVTVEPKDTYFSRLGISYADDNQFEKSIAAFRKALELNPASEIHKKNLAQAELLPEYAAQNEKGNQYFEAKDYKKAAAAFEQAAKLFPNPTILFSLGNAYYNSKQYSKAVPAYRETVRLDPNFPKAKEYLADAEKADQEKKDQRKATWLGVLDAVDSALSKTGAENSANNGANQAPNGNPAGAGGGAGGAANVGHPLRGRYVNTAQGIRSFTFSPNGTFQRGGAASGSYGSGEYAAGYTNSGTYSINGETLTLTYADGKSEQLKIEIIVGTDPGDSAETPFRVIIGGTTYTQSSL